MIRLRHVFGAQTGKVVELDKPVVRCGRLPDNDLAFDPYADIDSSGRHAEIVKEGDAWYVVDTGSRNGTMINGQRVQRQRVSHGDVIEFGKGGPRVQVELPSAAPAPAGRAAGEIAASPAAPEGPPRVVITVGSTPPPGASTKAAPSPLAAAAHPAPAAGGAGSGGPGKATVAMMIESAVKGRGKSTDEIKAITADAVHRSSRRLRIALYLVTMLLLLAVGGGALVMYLQRQDAANLQGDLRSAYERLEQINRAGDAVRAQDSAERAGLQTRIQELSKQLQEQSRGPGAHIAQQAQNAVYMLAALPADGRGELGFCTAFAVAPDLLATNAHCVLDMEQMQREGTRFIALPNGGQGGRFGVTWMGRHPQFVNDAPNPTADCGLVRIAGQAPSVLRLAAPADLARLQPGDTIHVYGFPGNLMEARSPVATLTSGVIGRITSFEGLSAPFAQSLLLQHSAFTSPGTSGSPMFNNDGLVIGVNTGAFRRLARQTMIDPTTGRRGDVLMTQDLSGYAFGVRADLVQQIVMGLQAAGGPPAAGIQ